MPLSFPVMDDPGPVAPIELDSVIDRLRMVREDWRQSQARHAEYGEHGFPSRHAIARIVDLLSAVLFPLRLGPAELTSDSEDAFVRASLESALPLLATQIRMELAYSDARGKKGLDIDAFAQRIISALADALPEIRRLLDSDLEAAYQYRSTQFKRACTSMIQVSLTRREQEILELVALGKSAKEVAQLCQIAPRTVECHLDTMRLKMRARNRTHMVAIAIATNLLTSNFDLDRLAS